VSEKVSDGWNTREKLEFVVKLARENNLERLTVNDWGIDVINNPVLQAQVATMKTVKPLTAEEEKAEEERTLFWSSR